MTPLTQTGYTKPMKKIALIAAALVAMTVAASAGTSCTSYRSGSYTKTSCTHSYGKRLWVTRGLSYKSGSYRRSSWN
jgi:hypothetical protein